MVNSVMSRDKLYILVADYVPLANKGEEAIIRGIEDMLCDDRPVELGLFDNVETVTRHGNITVFPRRWVFRAEGNDELPLGKRAWLQVAVALQMRMGMYGRLRHLVSSRGRYKALGEFFRHAEYVVVGHNGVFCPESCGVIHLAKTAGKRTGILGSGSGIGRAGRLYKGWLYRQALGESDFCIFREFGAVQTLKRLTRQPEKLILAPDPAFAMRPAEAEKAKAVLELHEGYMAARRSGRAVVGASVLEQGIVYRYFRPELDRAAKRQAHAEYVGSILDRLVQEGAYIVFLPHAVERLASDVEAARQVGAAMRCGPENRMILDEDLEARVLKSIIRELDFVIGERTHCLIASVSVGTPFVGLTNGLDRRTHDIIGRISGCEAWLVDMDREACDSACAKATALFKERLPNRPALAETGRRHVRELQRISEIVKGRKGVECGR